MQYYATFNHSSRDCPGQHLIYNVFEVDWDVYFACLEKPYQRYQAGVNEFYFAVVDGILGSEPTVDPGLLECAGRAVGFITEDFIYFPGATFLKTSFQVQIKTDNVYYDLHIKTDWNGPDEEPKVISVEIEILSPEVRILEAFKVNYTPLTRQYKRRSYLSKISSLIYDDVLELLDIELGKSWGPNFKPIVF